MYNISDQFLAPAHGMIFGSEMPRISEAGREAISHIGNWYLLRYFTYIRVVGITAAPHLFPKYIPDRIILKEFAFKIFE